VGIVLQCVIDFKGLADLGEHQVRRWDSWYRWVTLAMLATAFLTITAAAEHARQPVPRPASRSPATRFTACSPRSSSGHCATPGTGCAGNPRTRAGRARTSPGEPTSRMSVGSPAGLLTKLDSRCREQPP
jgi:hypothetical protein